MGKKGDQGCQREYRSPINGERNSPEIQTADKQRLDQPGDADGSLQSSVNQGGIQQWTQLNFGQRGARNSIDQGREQLQALMQQQPDPSRRERRLQQSTSDCHTLEIRQAKLARKRQADKEYRERKKLKNQQTEADLEKLRSEYGQLKDEYQKMKSDKEKFEAENGHLKDEYQKMKSEAEKFEAENGQLKDEYQKMKSDKEKFEAENGQLKDECLELKSKVEIRRAENGQLPHECQGMKSYDSVCFSSLVPGYNDNVGTRYPGQGQLMNGTSFVPHEQQLVSNASQSQSTRNDNNVVGLALFPTQTSTSGFQNVGSSVQPSNINPFDDWSHNRDNGVDEHFTEEEIRIRIDEMLENEDMQHMLRHLSMEGHASINMPEEGYAFPPYMPSPVPNYDEDRSRPGRDVVGWLKIKAAMMWGFFIRKKAAERRAQIFELEEEEWQSDFFGGAALSFNDFLLGCH